MVFFFIACHKPDRNEEDIENMVKTLAYSAKPLGDVYDIRVFLYIRHYLLD
jgi:hypothetical protein